MSSDDFKIMRNKEVSSIAKAYEDTKASLVLSQVQGVSSTHLHAKIWKWNTVEEGPVMTITLQETELQESICEMYLWVDTVPAYHQNT